MIQNPRKAAYNICFTLFIFTNIAGYLAACNSSPYKETADNSPKRNIVDTAVISKNDSIAAANSVKTGDTLICVDYAESESFSSKDEGYDYKGYVARNKAYLLGKTKLTKKNIRKQLFSGVDSIDIENIYDGQLLEKKGLNDYISGFEFYLLDTVFDTEYFIGVIYEQIFDEGAFKYFSTINKNGEYISRIIIACYVHSGSYTAGDGSRPPWYSGYMGCIGKDSIIEIGGPQASVEKKYRILASGKIMPL